ncbi:MAG: hypothetical protein GEV28_32535 [Actinophytocola sp.]|uniref:RRQRL motif-containing zinc-binding protein n=1 Tax=Actinophytocola sp. TaxID=1872138 RepID=UPI001322AAB6|nr:RRQRL motif-containing zinc-binding protein [Actinophytocola sp.]MPZ84859.1 hypothetical protein [Actinophytocola sp.]
MSGRRQYPWIKADDVPWSQGWEFIRGHRFGLPLLSYGIAPRGTLATRRQLRAMNLRPGGAEPVAYLYFWCRRGNRMVFAELFMIATAVPKRPASPAQHTALAKANLARRICKRCGRGCLLRAAA